VNFLNGESIYSAPRKNFLQSGHIVAALLCVVFFIGSIIVFFSIKNYNDMTSSIVPSFTEALDNGEYTEALEIYRSVQDKVVSADPDEEDDYTDEVKLLDSMQAVVSDKTFEILNRVRSERYKPVSTDVKFLNDMQELTSSIVSLWLNDLCKEFLLGTIEKPDIIFVFEQMSPISNFSATAAPLLKEIDYVETAAGDCQNAELKFSQEKYVDAIKIYNDVISRYDGFVKDYCSKRSAEIKEIMYEPMIADGEHMLDTYRFYSAEVLLSDMAAIFPDDSRINADLLKATANTVQTQVYKGAVEVLCIRSLIADKSIAFSESIAKSSSDLYLTADEFVAILNQLYAKGYILVDAETMAGMENDTYMVEQNLVVPIGKKPVIIVIENLSYSATTYKDGVCRRIVLNDRGEVCGEYINSEGDTVMSRTAEAIGILDEFVDQHPDFTYDGAKGVISVSGYESCFGYIVSRDEIDDRNTALASIGLPDVSYTDSDIENNRNTVKAIAAKLLDSGWKFGSNTYGYINARSSDMATIQADTQKWLDQIGSLLGKTNIIVYPNGDYIYGTDDRAVYLKNLGFRIFMGIGSKPYKIYGSNYLYYDRALLNGKTLRKNDYSRLFNVNTVYDKDRIIPLK